MSTAALDFRPSAQGIPAELRIPPRPILVRRPAEAESAWREAMRWSLIALTASLAAGEVLLALTGA